MMRRASSAARAVSGMDVRDADRDDPGMAIPTLSWPPDPPPPSYESIVHTGKLSNLKLQYYYTYTVDGFIFVGTNF